MTCQISRHCDAILSDNFYRVNTAFRQLIIEYIHTVLDIDGRSRRLSQCFSEAFQSDDFETYVVAVVRNLVLLRKRVHSLHCRLQIKCNLHPARDKRGSSVSRLISHLKRGDGIVAELGLFAKSVAEVAVKINSLKASSTMKTFLFHTRVRTLIVNASLSSSSSSQKCMSVETDSGCNHSSDVTFDNYDGNDKQSK